MQQAAAAAMAELVWLYEHTYHAFGVVVAGSGVLEAVQRHPQLATRIMGSVHFQPLSGGDLIRTVQALDERFAATRGSTLLAHDEALCLGRLRPWAMTLEWLHTLGVHEGPVTPGVLAQIAHLMVSSEVGAA